MLDIKLILEHPDAIRESIKHRGAKAELEHVLALHQKRKLSLLEVEQQRAKANQIAKRIPQLDASEKAVFIEQGRVLNQSITKLEDALRQIEEAYYEALLTIPNLLAEDTPLGETDTENLVIRTHGVPRTFDFEPKDHVELGKTLDLIDFDNGAKVAASKFYFLKNDAVFLEFALKALAMKVASSCGYTPLITPDLARKSILIGAGFTPRGEQSNIYHV
jgi:seryl-tRNA synthetase